jgi:hypothetical protein
MNRMTAGHLGTQDSMFPPASQASPPGVAIRPMADFQPWQLQLIERSRLSDVAPIDALTVEGTNRGIAYATHGVFRFFGKFPPPIARALIELHTRPGDVVWDPTAGSGTTGVECLLLGRHCQLRDVNPLSLLLARVKTRPLDSGRLIDAIEGVRSRYRPLSVQEYGFEPRGLRNAAHWFLPSTADSLRGLRKAIEEAADESVRDLLWVAFASTVRRVSRATTQQGRLFLDKVTALPDALEEFLKRALAAARCVGSLPSTEGIRIEVAHHDLRSPFQPRPDLTPLAIVHPPYFNAYRYSSINSLELAWLGYPHAEVRRNEVREFFKLGKPERIGDYLDDMSRAITNMAMIVQNAGVLALMIGDTLLKGEHLPTTRLLLDRIADGGKWETEKISMRVPRFTEATWVASQRRSGGQVGVKLCDFVVVLRRN